MSRREASSGSVRTATEYLSSKFWFGFIALSTYEELKVKY